MPQNADYFIEEYENMALDFLRQYDNSMAKMVSAQFPVHNSYFRLQGSTCHAYNLMW